MKKVTLTLFVLLLCFVFALTQNTLSEIEEDINDVLETATVFENLVKSENSESVPVLSKTTATTSNAGATTPAKDTTTGVQGGTNDGNGMVGGMTQSAFVGLMVGILGGIIGLVLIAAVVVGVIVAVYVSKGKGHQYDYDFSQKVELDHQHITLLEKKK